MYVTNTVYHSFPVGILQISGSDEQIEAIKFCGERPALPQEPVSSPSPLLQQCIDELNEYFQGERQEFSVPFSQSGTPFQQRVWKELLNIPYGNTISYLELSKRLGDPKAIRAAASTNGKNKLAIIVPCHRVIGANRELVGYAGGLPQKKWLLQHEARIACGVQTLF
ncbi:MAG: methylated-DNA--[protein]-cysteine S-methyltransferase [Williamsia sp.]|nr:methylated-DNA--[protein]-cysteine S-methyltransferase [Williamsia sp.]